MMTKLAELFSGKRVLISGGLGFIGSNLARRLLQYGASVTIIDNLSPDFGGNPYNICGVEQQIQTIIADICDQEQLKNILPCQDIFFNLAAQISHVGSMQDPIIDLETNALKQIILLEMCRKFNPAIRIVYASTRQVYGRPQYLPVDEEHPLGPIDFNGISKLAGELYHQVSCQIYNTRTTCLRMTNVYGPRMRVRDAHKNFLGLWFQQLINEQAITIYGDGQQLRDLNYIDDIVNALLICATSPQAEGQVYNLGDHPISLLELAKTIIEVNGSGNYCFMPFPQEREKIDIGNYYSNYAKIQTQLGWKPTTSLYDGIEKTLEFYRANWSHYTS